MNLAFQVPLDAPQLVQIETILTQSDDPRLQRRAIILRLLHDGLSPAQVAERAGVSVKTVYAIRRRFQAEGLEGLKDRPRSGRPRKATDSYCQLLETVLAHHPSELGYDGTGIPPLLSDWTANRLRAHLERETGIRLSGSRLRALLREMGYTYQRTVRNSLRPTHTQRRARLKLPIARTTYTWVRRAAP